MMERKTEVETKAESTGVAEEEEKRVPEVRHEQCTAVLFTAVP